MRLCYCLIGYERHRDSLIASYCQGSPLSIPPPSRRLFFDTGITEATSILPRLTRTATGDCYGVLRAEQCQRCSPAFHIFPQRAPFKMVNYLRDGLVGVNRLQYQSSRLFKTAINKQISGFQLNGAAQYVVFSPVTQQEFEGISTIRDAQYKGLRFMYIGGERTLIIKFGVSIVHELAHRVFVRRFEQKLLQMGLDSELEPIGAAGFSGPGGEKEADSAFKPSSRSFEADWPTVVFECGVSESLARLQVDAQWWLENSAGEVKTVIVISVSEPERSFHLEKWELADAPDPFDPSLFPPTITQEADIIGEEVHISARGVTKTSFVIDFTKIMLRQPLARRGEDNFTFSKEDLVGIVGRVWRNSQ